MLTSFSDAMQRLSKLGVLTAEPAKALAIELTLLEAGIAAVNGAYKCTGLQTPGIILRARHAT